MKLVLYTDGAARGNPGPASIAVVLLDSHGNQVQAFGAYIGRATNNEAEYRALLRGLEIAVSYQPEELEIRTDSELLALQLKGRYRVRAKNLMALHEQAQRQLTHFSQVSIRHIPREQNRLADTLANQALDAR